MLRALLAALCFAALAGAAWSADRIAFTPSGKPDVVFAQTDAPSAAGKIASKCMDLGWTVISSGAAQVVCQPPMGFWQSVLAQFLIGNSDSTAPKAFVRVSVIQLGADSRAQADGWIETQMAYGQVRDQPFADDASFNELLTFLMRAGGRLPSGTTFPVRAYLGVDIGTAVARKDGEASVIGLTVTGVTPGSPGAAAGLAAGDTIIRVGGASFKTPAQFRGLLAKAPLGQNFEVVVERAGAEVPLTVLATPQQPVP